MTMITGQSFEIDESVAKAIKMVVDYSYEHERQHYLDCPEGERGDHIFLSLDKVCNWLNEL